MPLRRSRVSRSSTSSASKIGAPPRSTSMRSCSCSPGVVQVTRYSTSIGRNGETCIDFGVRALDRSPQRVEHVPGALAPRRVGDLEHERVEPVTVRRPAVVDGQWVGHPPEGAEVSKQRDSSRRPSPEPGLHQVAHRLAERPRAAVEEVAPPEADRGHPPRRPERDRVERSRECVDVEIREEQLWREVAGESPEATMTNGAAIDRRGRRQLRNGLRAELRDGHHDPTRAATTSRALCTPSS